jgi:hypothetical protein
MSCHRVRRALLWMTRFGEFGPDSQLHLEHLAGCRSCRDDVGCDRQTVRLLRAALAARVDGMEPSPTVWEQVRIRAQQPERRRFPWRWRRASDALGVGRSLTAMAGTGLALVLALNTQVVTVTAPRPDGATPAALSQADGVPSAWDRLPRLAEAGSGGSRLDLDAPPDPEGLLVSVDAGEVLAAREEPAREEAPAPAPGVVVVVRIPLPPEPPRADTSHDDRASGDAVERPEPSPLPAGAPT